MRNAHGIQVRTSQVWMCMHNIYCLYVYVIYTHMHICVCVYMCVRVNVIICLYCTQILHTWSTQLASCTDTFPPMLSDHPLTPTIQGRHLGNSLIRRGDLYITDWVSPSVRATNLTNHVRLSMASCSRIRN